MASSSVPPSGDRAPRRGTAEATGAVHAEGAALPSEFPGALPTHTHAIHTHAGSTPRTLLGVQGTACSQALPRHTRTHQQQLSAPRSPRTQEAPPTLLHTYAPAGRPPCTCPVPPTHPSLASTATFS